MEIAGLSSSAQNANGSGFDEFDPEPSAFFVASI
jgi:hypothetical protein